MQKLVEMQEGKNSNHVPEGIDLKHLSHSLSFSIYLSKTYILLLCEYEKQNFHCTGEIGLLKHSW